jgi:hypothetical protein
MTCETVISLQEKIKELKMSMAYKTEKQKGYLIDGSKDHDNQTLQILEKTLDEKRNSKLLKG